MWNEVQVVESSNANVKKYVFKKGNAVAEAVLYKYPTYQERTVICCSTQSGCPVGCRFCGAGDYFVRSLTADEIVSQPDRLLVDTGVNPRDMKRLQIMFMSMGEPLLNMGSLCEAIRHLHICYPKAALLVSTIGPRVDYQRIIDISSIVPTVGLQFSVHKSTDESRDGLIPFKAKLSLSEIAWVGGLWRTATGRTPFFNYCAAEDNTTDADADRLAEMFKPRLWNATISVICERNEHVAAANERQRMLAETFQQKLIDRGYSTRVFDPAGQDDIGGGCGQLWFVQEWMRNNPSLVRPSIGNGLPMVHVPEATT
jgi:23S rRNA (adenine2503-C2)-methyltransferase